jgi:hypothetical protein
MQKQTLERPSSTKNQSARALFKVISTKEN